MLDPKGSSYAVEQHVPIVYSYREKIVICLYEFIGTAMLLLGYNLTTDGVAVAFSLFVGILLAGKVSGAQFNPAITICIYVSDGSFISNIGLVVITIIS